MWRHNDIAHVEELLAAEAPERPRLIVFEAPYSIACELKGRFHGSDD
jgi:5-aminolevulinate synthase